MTDNTEVTSREVTHAVSSSVKLTLLIFLIFLGPLMAYDAYYSIKSRHRRYGRY